MLASIDSDTGKITLINISRDAMVDVDVYDIEGKYIDTEKMQICLAFAYGDGGEKSVENTMKSVSRLMYGIPMHAYAAIDIPSISVINDAIGGVEVDVLEDLSAQDPLLVEGKHVLLKGGTAVTYIRSRQWGAGAPVDANNYRMRRQKQYITNFIIKAIDKIREDVGMAPALYNAVKSYLVTDIDVNQTAYLASLVAKRNFTEGNILTIPGSIVRNGDYANFIVDEDGLYEMILNNFYVMVE